MIDIAFKEQHTGAMVALYPSFDDAEALSTAMSQVDWPAGATVTEPQGFHLTLAYLGEASEIDEARRAEMVDAVKQLAQTDLPAVRFNGVARFNGSDEDGDPIVMLFSEAVLNEMATFARQKIGDASEHPFLAHMTLAYIPKGAPTPTVPAPKNAMLQFQTLSLVFADEHLTDIEIGAGNPVTKEAFKIDAQAFITTLKANYSAKVGQTIAGNLARGAGGKFTAAGNAGASASAGSAKRAQARKAALAASGVSEQDAATLEAFAKGGTLSAAQTQSLVSAGLVRVGDDGSPRLAPNARGFLRALRKGDARAASDAAGAARDAGNRRTEAAARKAEAARRRAERDAKKNQPKPAKGKQPKPDRTPEQVQKIGNRVEEIDAQLNDAENAGKTLSETQLTKALNRLEELDTQLGKLSDGDAKRAAQEAIAKTRRRLEVMRDGDTTKPDATSGGRMTIATREASGVAEVFKDASGAARWMVITSNAYEDKEGEIVSQAALEADVARWWQRREKSLQVHDPLRWWHVGNVRTSDAATWQDVQAGEGLDIGQCDFRMLHGRMLVESGTFNTPELAAAFAPHMKGLRVSLGFATPAWQPVDGVYQDIHSFERSLLPMAKEANALTGGIILKGVNDMTTIDEKVKAFANIAGEGAAGTLAQFLSAAEAVDKQAEAEGIRHKEEDATPEAQGVAASAESGNPPSEGAEAQPGASGEAVAASVTKAEGDMAEGGDMAEDVAEDAPADEALMVGDMTAQELAEALAAPLAAAMAEAMKPVTQAFDEQNAVIKAQGEKLAKVERDLSAANAKVKELEGDAPKGYRASQDAETVSKETEIARQPVNELAALADQFLAAYRGK